MNVNPNTRTFLALTGFVAGMFVFAWALVPLYDLFCEVTGLNGKVQNVAAAPVAAAISSRTVNVRFVAHKGEDMDWEFTPVQRSIELPLNQEKTVFFKVRNTGLQTAQVRAVPSVVPGMTVKWLHKVECFCFQAQTLDAGAEANLGMRFYVSDQLPVEFEEMTVAYTLYFTESQPDNMAL
ncbi:MAG: cytochrome c oxidase assembly protein [Gammaproteobacteria bacterium]